MNKKTKNYALEGDASFKQCWKIAHNFAKKSESLFPDYDHKKLAHLFNGTIFYYHDNLGTKLSKKEASEFITNDPEVPQHYIDELVAYLKNRVKPKSPNNPSNRSRSYTTTNSSNSLLDLMQDDIKNRETE